MNIYLDIDGVILGTRSPKGDVMWLITFLLDNFKGKLYWLTSHCQNGSNRIAEWLSDRFPEDLLQRMVSEIRPADWKREKTEAIDFSVPFLWLEDTPTAAEARALISQHAENQWIPMDPNDPEMAIEAILLIMEQTEDAEGKRMWSYRNEDRFDLDRLS